MTTIADTFTRADSSSSLGTASDGGTWTIDGTAVYGISTNRAYLVSNGARDRRARRDAGGPVLDYTIDNSRAFTNNAGWLWLNYDPGTDTGYGAFYDSSSPIQVFRWASATLGTQVGTDVAITSWTGSSTTLRVTSDGAGTIKIYQNGTLKGTCVDGGTPYTGTWVGFGATGTAAGEFWDNFSATGTALPPPPAPRRSPITARRRTAITRAAVI